MLDTYTKAAVKSLKHNRQLLNARLLLRSKYSRESWLQSKEKWDKLLFNAHNHENCSLDKPSTNKVKNSNDKEVKNEKKE